MRFSCDSCQARYTIADDKVRGKLLRVRCKKCGSAILLKELDGDDELGVDSDETRVVRTDEVQRAITGPAAPAPASLGTGKFVSRHSQTGSAVRAPEPAPRPAPAPPVPAEKRQWFVLLAGKEVGPLTRSEVAERIAATEVHARTYTWRDGMPQWARLKEVAELASLLGPALVPAPPPPPPPEADDDDSEATRADDDGELARAREQEAEHAREAEALRERQAAEKRATEDARAKRDADAKQATAARAKAEQESAAQRAKSAAEKAAAEKVAAEKAAAEKVAAEKAAAEKAAAAKQAAAKPSGKKGAGKPPSAERKPAVDTAPVKAPVSTADKAGSGKPVAAADPFAAVVAAGTKQAPPAAPVSEKAAASELEPRTAGDRASTALALAALLDDDALGADLDGENPLELRGDGDHVPAAGPVAPPPVGSAGATEAPADRAAAKGAPATAPKPDHGPVVGGAAARQSDDPFADVPDAPGFKPPEPGETTNAIIRASGAKERNYGKMVAQLVVLVALLAGAAVLGLQQSGVMTITAPPPPPAPVAVASTDPAPVLDQASLDVLSGETKRRAERERLEAEQRLIDEERAKEAAARKAEEDALLTAGLLAQDVDTEGAIKTVRQEPVQKLEATPEQLALLASLQRDRARGGPGTSGPRAFVHDDTFDVKKTAQGSEGGGPDPAAVSKKLFDARPGIEQCIGTALRRNPDQKLGKVVITATIAPSGVVTQAVFSEKRISDSELGTCLRRTIKGIVFPAFEGEPTDIEIPYVLGSG